MSATMSSPRHDVAAQRQQVSDMTLKYAGIDRLVIFRIMRRHIVEDLRALVPTARIHWVCSRVAPKAVDLTGITSEDDARALVLATKMRTTRRQWHGYRTDLDFWADTEVERR